VQGQPALASAGSSAPASPAPSPITVGDESPSQWGQAVQDREGRASALTDALHAYDDSEPSAFSVSVVNRRTGETYSYRGQERFQTASIVKVDILATLLLKAQQAGRGLTAGERALAEKMIKNSDNNAASALWSEIGSGSGLAKANGQFGLTGTTPGPDGAWGSTTTTAEDQARLLSRLLDDGPLTDASQDYVLGLMASVERDQAWGVSSAAGNGERVQLKNGWLDPTNLHGRWVINSIGRVTDADTDVTLVVLSRGHTSMGVGTTVVGKIAALTRQYLKW
jgi:beta-lactamase class A